MATLEQLKEAHDLVKKNKFRLNGDKRYVKGYQKLLHKMTYIFGNIILENNPAGKENMEYRAGIFYFGHEFSSNVRYLGYEEDNPYKVERFSIQEIRLVMEMNIGLIHRFIDTGEFTEYFTYYTGDYCEDGRLMHNIYKKKWKTVQECDKVSELKMGGS